MKEFWLDFKKSIYGPGFYAKIPNKPFSSAFGYFFALITILALITTVIISFQLVPRAVSFLNSFSAQAISYYPDNMEITAKGGNISTNILEPYFFPMPPALKTGTSNFDNLLVIDTKSPLSIGLFQQYKTMALLTKDSFVVYDRGAIKIQPLNHIPDGTFTKAKMVSAVNAIRQYFKVIPALIVIGVFIGVFLVNALNLLYLVFAALIILVILKIRKIRRGYKESYKIGLYAMTPSLLVSTLFTIVGISAMPFMFTIILLGVLIVNMKVRESPQT